MFLGNMQSFYKRNSIHGQSPSHISQVKSAKELTKRSKNVSKYDKDCADEYGFNKNVPIRRRSCSDGTERETTLENVNKVNIPIIKIGLYEPENTRKYIDVLAEKKEALWYNSAPEPDDDSVRLGPNRNNIIQESLKN